MIANKVKPTKIYKILEDYVKQGTVPEDELPSTVQIQALRRNTKKRETTLETQADFSLLTENFSVKDNTSEYDPILIGENLSSDDFCLVFTSKQLLKNVIGQASSCSTRYLCLDATYKLTVIGYPLLVFGTQNNDHKFKLVALTLSRHEREKDFSFALLAIKHALQEFYNYEWGVDFIMADGSPAIRNAAKEVFGNKYQHGMCSVHMRRNVEKKITSYVKVDSRKELRKDIDFLEKIHDMNLFKAAISLFEKKWIGTAPDFIKYFNQTWVYSDFCNWYRGAVPCGFSHTNNGIEGFNFGIKQKYTDWDRYQLNEFINVLKEIIGNNSKEALDEPFVLSFNLDQNLWIKVQEMMDDPFKQEGENIFYWCQFDNKDGKRNNVTGTMLKKYSEVKRVRSFDTFKDSLCLWKVVVGENISTTTCTCPQFRLYHCCKHVVNALLKLNKIQIPNEFSTEIVVGPKNKRGRPKKATQALDAEDS